MKPYRLIFSSKMYPFYWEDVQNLPVIDSKTIFKGTEAIMDKRQREIKYRQLSESLKRGYNPKQPISIMLCRHWGYKDSLDDGHHRLSVCIQNEIETVYVRFCYASSVKILIPFSRRWI